MQFRCFQILDNEILIIKGDNEYKDTPENFLLDGGSLDNFAVSKPNETISFEEPEVVIYDNTQKHCLVNGELFEYPNETLESYIDNILTYINNKEERTYVPPAQPSEEELKQAEADNTKAKLRNFAVNAMMMTLADSAITEIQNEYVSTISALSDDVALLIPEVYPVWSADGKEYNVNDRVTYNGVLYKVLQDHTSQATWTPTDAPSLFTKVLVSTIDEPLPWKQPDSTNGYMTGDKVTYNGKMYESLIDNNAWSPEAYPTGWREL